MLELPQDISTDFGFLESEMGSGDLVTLGGPVVSPNRKITARTKGWSVALQFPGNAGNITAKASGDFSKGKAFGLPNGDLLTFG